MSAHPKIKDSTMNEHTKKMKDLVTFTEEILDGKLFCTVS